MDTQDGNSRETVLAHKGEVIRVIANSDGSSLISLLLPDAAYRAGMALVHASEQARTQLMPVPAVQVPLITNPKKVRRRSRGEDS